MNFSLPSEKPESYSPTHMKVFRGNFVYNSDNPVYTSSNARSYTCRDNVTNNNRLIIVEHLKEIPKVENHPSVLQPIEAPTLQEPFSVYHLCNCCSEIDKIDENDAMYVLKSLLESPQKESLYKLLSPSGICTSNVEGLLPEPSPKLFDIMISILDIPANLAPVPRTLLSKQCTALLRGLKEGENVLGSVNLYGWKDKKDVVKDNQFWIFKGRRREEGIMGDEYGLAWKPKLGLVKFRMVQTGKDGVERYNMADFTKRCQFYIENTDKKFLITKIHKIADDQKSVKIFTALPNQGSLSDFLLKRRSLGRPITEEQFFPILQEFVENMKKVTEKMRGHRSMHIRYIAVDHMALVLGEPMLITDKTEKKLRELRNTMDYFAPEYKENIIIQQNIMKLDHEKMDIWSFGFLLHKIFTFELPVFDPQRKVILKEGQMGSGIADLITNCLSINPAQRPRWADIDFKSIKNINKKQLVVEDFDSLNQKPQKEDIRLGSRKESRDSKLRVNTARTPASENKSREIYSPLRKESEESPLRKKDTASEVRLKEDELDVDKEMIVEEVVVPKVVLPHQLTSRLKKIKLVFKVVFIILLYLLIFFRPFLSGSANILASRGFLNPATLYSLDSSGNTQSSVTILTSDPKYFMLNDISFGDIQNNYHCINDQFDPVYNPYFSLNSYIQSNGFVGLMISGWLWALLVCVLKSFMIWNGGIGNKQEGDGNKYWAVYVFSELSMATLLFAHFYIYEFFYFSKVQPCMSITAVNGTQPFFDSILYLFLSNINGYLVKIITTMGIFSLVLAISIGLYALAPRTDLKVFFAVPSIVLRIVPYLIFVLVSRIGVFSLYAPTPINDPLKMLPSLVNYSFVGFLGIIPEIFIVICVVGEILVELLFYYCEKNASKSDLLNRLFNTDKRKLTTGMENMAIPDESMMIPASSFAN